MPTIAHRPLRLPVRASRRLTIWLLGAILVVAVAAALAVSLIGSDAGQADTGGDAPPAAQQAPAPLGGSLP